jgi:uncharacterized protein (DUF952 family)
MKKFVYKICTKSQWYAFKKKKLFYGNKMDLLDGYIHLSNKNQVKITLKRYFLKKKKLVLLKIESNKLKDLKFEKSSQDKLFPHLYSRLDIDKVKNVYKIFFEKKGFRFIPFKY